MKKPENSRIAKLEAEIRQLRKELSEAKMLNQDQEQTRQAMLFALEDLQKTHETIEHAKREWENTFDAVAAPIFLCDDEGRVIRANQAYAKCARRDIKHITGEHYWDVFPKGSAPLQESHTVSVMGETEEEVRVDDATYLSHTYPVYKGSGQYAYTVHMLKDISARKQAEELLAQSRNEIRDSLEATVAAVGKTVEARDLYTAGHQQRVAQLACAIGQHMGLDEERIKGIRLGSLIHDIGKIHIPAEILTKPSRLTDLEVAMVRTHSEVGYTILRDVPFPWPVTPVVHQHHERLDGSGYPLGLEGDDICLEARITSVADVVDAMSSHRPYRPSLGIELALNELKTNQGRFYDSDAVDACLELFHEHDFDFGKLLDR